MTILNDPHPTVENDEPPTSSTVRFRQKAVITALAMVLVAGVLVDTVGAAENPVVEWVAQKLEVTMVGAKAIIGVLLLLGAGAAYAALKWYDENK